MTPENTRWTRIAALVVPLVSALGACDGSLTVQSFSGPTMGTSYDVVVESRGPSEDTVELGRLIAAELAHVNRVMSTFDSASDLSRFGRHERTDPMQVDPALLHVLGSALDVSRRSGGAFDPTVAPLVDAWGFGPEDVAPPDAAVVAALREMTGYVYLVPDVENGTLSKTKPGVRIDLSGIAKGYAAERIATALEERGYGSALVDVGGELRVLGSHLDGRPWRVAFEGPGVSSPEPLGTVELVDEAIATSGDFRNYYEVGGVVYAHIVDPRSGEPLRFKGFSVSVLHPSATLADAWATALTVLGPETGLELAEREGLAAVFATRGPAGVEMRVTSALVGRITPIE